MATPITWRNINAPDQNDAARLAISGSQQLTSGLKSIGNEANRLRKEQQALALKENKAKTDNLLNTIQSFNAAQLAEAKASGAFDQQVLLDSGISQDNVNTIFKAFNDQEANIHRKEQDAFNRNLDVLRRDQRTKQVELDATAQDIQATNQQHVQANQADFITDKEKAIRSNLRSDIEQQFDTELSVKEDRLNRLTSLQKSLQKNPEQGSTEYAKQLSSLNQVFQKMEADASYSPFDTSDVDKEDILKAMRDVNASPAQAEAALTTVTDGDGDYDLASFKSTLADIVKNPSNSKLRTQLDAMIKASGYDTVEAAINAGQTELDSIKIGRLNTINSRYNQQLANRNR